MSRPKSFALISPKGTRISGTLEKLYGRGCVTGWHLDENGEITPDWEGSTDVFWEGSETVEEDGVTVAVDEQGEEYPVTVCLRVEGLNDGESPEPILDAWSRTYGVQADAEGWSLFNDGEIQRDDASAIFADDQEAVAFVIASAACGVLAAQHALWIVGKFHPEQLKVAA